MNDPSIDEQTVYSITRPHPNLLVQYGFWSLSTVIPVALPALLIKYFTLRYRFDSEGISMSWGLFFRREISLTYARIQDIHLVRGLIERWLGLATLSIQTASGSASAEIAMPGLDRFEEVRDFLYLRMRGGRRHRVIGNAEGALPHGNEVLELLRDIHSDLKEIRRAFPAAGSPLPSGSAGDDER